MKMQVHDGKSYISVPMFVCLAGYLDVLAFPPKFINVDFNAGNFICGMLVFVVFRPTY